MIITMLSDDSRQPPSHFSPDLPPTSCAFARQQGCPSAVCPQSAQSFSSSHAKKRLANSHTKWGVLRSTDLKKPWHTAGQVTCRHNQISPWCCYLLSYFAATAAGLFSSASAFGTSLSPGRVM